MSYGLFIKEIQQRPDDDVPRLVFADWLEEQGDVWGGLIRSQCELARCEKGSDAKALLEQQVDRMLERHHRRFFAPLYRWGAMHAQYSRGFLDQCRFLVHDNFHEGVEDFKPLMPMLRSLTMVSRKSDVQRCERLGWALAELSTVAPLRSLDINNCSVEPRDIQAIVDSQLVDSLESLNVAWNLRVGQEGVASLLEAPWRCLRVLDLQGLSFAGSAWRVGGHPAKLILVNEGLKWLRDVYPGKVVVAGA